MALMVFRSPIVIGAWRWWIFRMAALLVLVGIVALISRPVAGGATERGFYVQEESAGIGGSRLTAIKTFDVVVGDALTRPVKIRWIDVPGVGTTKLAVRLLVPHAVRIPLGASQSNRVRVDRMVGARATIEIKGTKSMTVAGLSKEQIARRMGTTEVVRIAYRAAGKTVIQSVGR